MRQLPRLVTDRGIMSPELAELWATTLESGNFKQCKRVLRNGSNACCCLGVLADIVDPAAWSPSATIIADGDGYCSYAHNAQTVLPSLGFLVKVGLSHDDAQRFANLNDNKGYRFDEIAAYIRQKFIHDDPARSFGA